MKTSNSNIPEVSLTLLKLSATSQKIHGSEKSVTFSVFSGSSKRTRTAKVYSGVYTNCLFVHVLS